MIGQAQAPTAAVYHITRQRIYIFTYIYIYISINQNTILRKAILAMTRQLIERQEIQKVQLPDPSFEEQITIAFQTNTSLEEAFKSIALPIETIDDLGT